MCCSSGRIGKKAKGAAGATLVGLVVLALAACGQDNGDAIDPRGDDLQVIEKEVEGVTYRCLYLYRDGGYDGGPALWCDRLTTEERTRVNE